VKVALALVALAAAAPAQAAGPLVSSHREYGGIVGGSADVQVARDGRTATRSRDCSRSFTISAKRLHRLRVHLRRARRRAHPRTVDQPSAEAPSVEIRSGRMHLFYRGFGVAPAAAQPLIDDLDRIAELRC
jgi:hypothetical protein